MNSEIQNYINQKESLLQKCLRVTEDFASNIDDWESFENILSERGSIIEKIKELEAATPDHIRSACPPKDVKRLDNMLNLILDLDKNAEKYIREAQAELMDSMKTNVQGQRFAHTGYNPQNMANPGGRLDYKK